MSAAELRDSLVAGGTTFRRQVLWHLERWGAAPEGDWREQTVELFREVWPKQRLVRTPATAAELVEFALSFPGDLPALVAAMKAHLVPIAADTWFMGALQPEDEARIDDHPEAILALLWGALAEQASQWPYGADRIVERLAARDVVAGDARLAELRRRLAAR